MKKLNIAELLRDCPSGMELDCTMWDNVVFDHIDMKSDYPIYIKKMGGEKECLTEDGRFNFDLGAKCVIFPKGKTTWEGFQRPFKDGDIVAFDNPHRDNLQVFIFKNKKENNTLSSCYLMLDDDELDLEEGMYYVTRFATEAEKQRLFKAVNANGYKWNPETKTLEKLIEPKFKVGDRIKSKDRYTNYCNGNHIFTITEIRDGRYWSNRLAIEYIENQNDWELVPKFNIATLNSFESRVLVRTDNRKWVAAFYSHYDKEAHLHYCVVGGLWYEQCIPYNNETKHLLNTTNECSEYYKTWK